MTMEKLKHNPFKQIKVYHIYEYYDEPILYSFTDGLGQYYIANFVDYKEKNDTDTWLYIPVSYNRLHASEQGYTPLLSLYKCVPSDIAFLEKISNKQDIFFIQKASEIDSDYLPDSDYYIRY